MEAKQIVAFAILASLLAVSASPVGALQASGQLVVGSQHDTQAEFSNAQTLTNLTVTNAGDGAVELQSGNLMDGFEDGDISEYTADTGSFAVQNAIVHDGSFALESSETTADIRILSTSGLSAYPAAGDRFTYHINSSSPTSGAGNAKTLFGVQDGSNYYQIVHDFYADEVKLMKIEGGSETSLDSVAVTQNHGTWYEVTVEWQTDGTIDITVSDDSGTQLATLTATDTTFSSGGIGFASYQEVTHWDANRMSSAGSATYVSSRHAVSNAEQAAINITAASNVSIDATVRTADGTTLATGTLTSVGNHTLTLAATSSNQLEIALDVSVTGDDPQFGLADESIQFTDHAPNATLQSPTGGEQLTASTVTLETLINDSEFGTAQGESVAVEFQTKEPGSSTFTTEETVTATENGTVSTSITASTGGTWEWRVVATDAYGEQTTTTAQTFDVPGNLYLRNVSNTSELVDSPVNVTVRFFGGEIETRESPNGTIDLSGLPVDEIFVVEVEPDQDYHARTVFIDDIYSQDSVYLLNESATSVESRFILEDPTGEFGPESIIYIQKPIEVNGSVEYRTAHADRFGVEGVTARLEQGDRYFIKLRRDGGTVQDIGPYRADVGETVTVRPGNPTVELGEYEDGWATGTEIRNRTLEFRYSDPAGETDQLKVWVHERNNESNVLGANRTFSSIGNVSGTYTLTENESAREWVVNYEIARNGNTFTKSQPVANNPDLVPELSREWRLIAGIGILFISAGIFSVLNAGIGGIVVALEGGILWWTGWLEGATAGAAVVIALFIGVVAHIYTRR